MAQTHGDFTLSSASRASWRRAAEELLIDAIFGDLPARSVVLEYACPTDEEEEELPLLVAAA